MTSKHVKAAVLILTLLLVGVAMRSPVERWSRRCEDSRALTIALFNRDRQSALYYLNRGADPNARYPGRKPPDLALYLKHLAGPNRFGPLNRDEYDAYALEIAVGIEDDTLVEALLEKGADPNAFSGYETPLMTAVQRNRKGIVKCLLAHGANVNGSNGRGDTALMRACGIDRGDIVRMLLDAGADVNHRDKSGNTALMVAAEAQDTRFMEMLLDRKLDINARNNMGETALMLVVDQPAASPETVRFMLQHGADPAAVSKTGVTALNLATYYVEREGVMGVINDASHFRKIVAILKQAGAKP